MINLITDRLRVEIMEPGEGSNRGCRFDRSGYISDVVLDGFMHFGASEPLNLCHPTSYGRGLCSELRADVSSEAGMGEYFPKFGVGLIRKEDEGKFVFYKQYKDVIPFEIEYEMGKNRVVFETKPKECLGYALAHWRELCVESNVLTMKTTLKNTGSKTIHMEEFCHNFISIDGMAVGSDYHLSMPAIPNLGYGRLNNRRGFSGAMRGEGKGITFCEFTAIDTDIAVDCSLIDPCIPFEWTMEHRGIGASVVCRDYFTPGKIAVWGVDHILSPEIVNCFTIAAGETVSWHCTWEFRNSGDI